MKKTILLIAAAAAFAGCKKCQTCTTTFETKTTKKSNGQVSTQKTNTKSIVDVCGGNDIKNAEKTRTTTSEDDYYSYSTVEETTCK